MSSDGGERLTTDTDRPGLVSVVLPVRFVNREWLTQSIMSVLEQDYGDVELIVVNDEATEDIDGLIADLGVTKYRKNDRNLKLPASLNRGFELAEGEFHTWTSADNYMLPGMISRLVDALNSNPEVGVVYGPCRDVDADGLAIEGGGEERAAKLAGTSLDARLVDGRFVYYSTLGACFLYRREVTERLDGYDEALHGAEDYDFWIRASRHFDIMRLPPDTEALYAYRTHGDSISATVRYCYTRMRADVLRRELRQYPEDDDLRTAYRHHLRLYRRQRLRQSLPVRAVRRLRRLVGGRDDK